MSPQSLLAGLLVAAFVPATFAASEPYVPTDDAEVLEHVATARAEADNVRALNAQRRALAAHPDDLPAAVAYARRAIEIGRATADPRYHGQAESALKPWLSLANPPPVIRLLRATLRQQRHDFVGAIADLDQLIIRNSGDVQARLTRATILMVQGRPADALNDCNALIAAHGDLIAAATCIASVRSLDGHASAAIEVLTATLAESANAPPGEQLWALTALAEIEARQGRTAEAGKHFEAAIALLRASGEHDPYLLTAYADYLLADGRAAEARELTRDSRQIDNLLLRLALAQAALGDPGFAGSLAQLDARFTEAGLRGGSVHLREEALYALRLQHEAARAVSLATQNWQSQREPADARLLLEASLAAAQPAAAQPALAWLTQTGIEDPALHRLADQLRASLAAEASR